MHSNANDKVKFRIDCFNDCISCKWGRDINNRSCCTCFLDCILYRIKDRDAFDLWSSFFWCNPGYDFCAVIDHFSCVKSCCIACYTLNNNFCILINIYTHFYRPPSASLFLLNYARSTTPWKRCSAHQRPYNLQTYCSILIHSTSCRQALHTALPGEQLRECRDLLGLSLRQHLAQWQHIS